MIIYTLKLVDEFEETPRNMKQKRDYISQLRNL